MQDLIDIRCPKCTKMLCKIEQGTSLRGIHFWCNRCQKEIEINIQNRAQKPIVEQ